MGNALSDPAEVVAMALVNLKLGVDQMNSRMYDVLYFALVVQTHATAKQDSQMEKSRPWRVLMCVAVSDGSCAWPSVRLK